MLFASLSANVSEADNSGLHDREGHIMKLALKRTLAAIILALSFVPVAADPLSEAYHRGEYATVLQIIRPLADQGDANSQYNLGIMYQDGQGVPRDYDEAVKWFRLAADQGYANAQYDLGIMYRDGQGVPRDYAEAVKWFRLAADQGDAEAQSNLGIRYAEGQGVPQDYVRAHMWFNLSAAKGNQMAIKNRDQVAGHMTPAQIAEAQRFAREWKPSR
jgi:uncharacterized protein